MVEIRNLEKTYRRKGREIRALRSMSFFAVPGEALGIVGESGSGKSTLLRLIACLERADQGRILIEGRDVTGRRTEDVCRDVQMVFQDAVRSFNPRKKIRSSIDEVLGRLRGKKGPELCAERERLIRMAGLSPELAERYPGQLSGGQCQRMAIARALAASPKVLLCDEITSALDLSAQAQIVRLLKRLQKELGLTVLFVSHDLVLAMELCDRLLVMKDGECVETGTPEEIRRCPKETYTRELLEAGMLFGRGKTLP